MGPDMEEKAKITPFDGSGFHNWRFRMETVLDTFDLLDCLEREVEEIEELEEDNGDTAQVKAEKKKKILERKSREKKCKSLIVQAISDNQLELIKDCKTPKVIWDTLKNIFEKRGVAGQLYIRKQLLTLRYTEGAGSSMSEHLMRFDRLIRELKGSGAKVEDSDAICHLLLTLPPSFDSVVTAIETLPGGVEMDFVRKRLLDVDMKRRNSDSAVQERGSDGVAMASKHKRKLKCYQCGKIGHKKAECRAPAKEKVNEKKQKSDVSNLQKANIGVREEKPEVAFVVTDMEDYVKIGWFLDSGATDHMVNDSKFFVSMRRLVNPIEILVANGQKLIVEYSGHVMFYVHVNGETKKCEAKDVLYLPGLSCNLFSVKRITRLGFKVSFDKDKAEVSRNGVIWAEGWLKDKLFELDVYCKETEMGCALVSGRVSRNVLQWHQRYGHVGNDNLKQIVRHKMVDGLNFTEFDDDTVVCEPCLTGKIVRLPFQSSRERRSMRPLELVHSDVCGPIVPHTWDGKKFFISFIDDYSHFTIIYLMASKDQVLHIFREYEALVTAHFGSRISRLRTDNGGEFVNDEMQRFCRNKGIAMETTIPYSPQQNGVSERMNRTLMERARAILAESGFGKEMWGEAVYTATYITNRCPTAAVDVNKTPYELWTGRKPNVSKLRIFGCAAYTHIPKQLRTKLDPKGRKLYMVGYTVNGYRLWDAEKGKVVVARDIMFDESSLFGEKQIVQEVSTEQIELSCGNLQAEDPEEASSEDDSVPENESQQTVTRRSERSRKDPVWFDCYEMSCGLALSAENFVEDLPNTVAELKKREDWQRWKEAITEEMESLEKNKTWVLTSLPNGRTVIDSKWVFKIKRNEVGAVDRYKARLVARGFNQRRGFDYEDTYSPVAKLTTLRVVLAVANFGDMQLHQLDVKTAFLNGNLKQDIYMRLPDEFGAGNLVAKLQKSLYGLKQASREWNRRFHDFIMNLGFRQSEADCCLYIACEKGEAVFLIIYVDDIIIASRSMSVIGALKKKLSLEFEMTDLNEVKMFLGLAIERDMEKGVLQIGQKQYLLSLLNRFGMGECKAAHTPIEVGLKLEKCTDSSKYTMHPYRELVGCLMYVTVTSRPDISAAVNYFSGFQSCATDIHWSHLKRILRYLRGTVDLKLVFHRDDVNGIMSGYVDSDWAGNITDRKSVSGYVFKVYSSTVSWATRKQTSVALSSAEAEYMALSVAVTEAIWLRRLLVDLGVNMNGATVLHEDNQACIKVAEEDKVMKRLKHVDVRYHFVRDEIQKRVIRLVYVPTDSQIADVMTKGLGRFQFVKLRELIGLSA